MNGFYTNLYISFLQTIVKVNLVVWADREKRFRIKNILFEKMKTKKVEENKQRGQRRK